MLVGLNGSSACAKAADTGQIIRRSKHRIRRLPNALPTIRDRSLTAVPLVQNSFAATTALGPRWTAADQNVIPSAHGLVKQTLYRTARGEKWIRNLLNEEMDRARVRELNTRYSVLWC